MPIIISGSNGISGVDGTAAAPAVQGADNNTGMFFPAADTIAFSEGGTEALRLNASGNAVFTGTIQVAGITTDIYPRVLGTAQASTSGTSIDFTGIPSWVRRVTVMFNSVSTNGSSILMVQLGSGSFVTTGYLSSGSAVGAASAGTVTSTAGFIFGNSNSAAALSIGSLVLNNISGTSWIASGAVYNTASPATHFCYGSSSALSGALDRVRITTVGGTDTFDAGSVNILWE